MAVREIFKLGNPDLYRPSLDVEQGELDKIAEVVQDLRDTMHDFRATWGVGRGIAAPQIGVFKRVIYMEAVKSVTLINPVLEPTSNETITVWDDCMSFPEVLVKVQRFKACRVLYRDMNWKEQEMDLQGDLSELIQHEYDHLDGVLAIQRAIDEKSFALRSQMHFIDKM